MNPIPMPKEINCQNFKGLIAYIRRNYGNEGVHNLLSGLVDSEYYIQDKYEPSRIIPIKEEHLTDQAYWVSNDFSLMLLSNVKKIVAGDNPLYNAGIGMVRESLSKTTLYIAKFLSQEMLAKRAARLNARFNKTKDVHLVSVSDSSAVFELIYKPGFTVTKDVCNWNLGIYTGITLASGVSVIKSHETQCVVDGAPVCRFEISWSRKSFSSKIFKGFLGRLVGWRLKDLILDYETTIDERDRLIEQLVKSEKKYRTLFEDSLEAITLSYQEKLIDVNAAWLRLHGFSEKSEVIGKPMIDFVRPEDGHALMMYFQQWPRQNPLIQLRCVKKDSETIDVEIYSSKIEYDEKECFLSTIRDLTEIKKAKKKRKELETKIQRGERMETVATLAGGVAHDLNNILSGIVGYPDIILMQLPAQSPLIRPIRTIQETGKKAAAIVEDLLALTRRGAVQQEVLNLNRIITDYLQSPEYFKMKSFHEAVRISIELAPDLLNIRGSFFHLSKVIMNLIANSSEAMPDGGVITVKTVNQYVDSELQGFDKVPEGEYCVLTVSDTGIGIFKEDMEKIFEPFYSKKKLGRSGTGLGMAVIWGTVKDHNGFIHINSEIGKGTEIKLFFPATRESLSSPKSIYDLNQLKGKGEKILIVDDVKEQRDITQEMLEVLGYTVSSADGGEQAIEYIKNESFDLLVLDMIMSPGMDGLDTYQRIIKEKPGQKAIIASGFSETERVRQAQDIGAGQYVKKPYTLEKIGLAVRIEFDRVVKK
jgi:PAS domain S-box-containing protein